jgi:uncharacterized damage-inducible protein DinB
MNDFLFDLFEYDHWASRQRLEHRQNLDRGSLVSERLLSHVAVVVQLWWKRLPGEDTSEFEEWPARMRKAFGCCRRALSGIYSVPDG